MLDWYTHGIPERDGHPGRATGWDRLGFGGNRSGSRSGAARKSAQTMTPEEKARFDAEWAAYLQEAKKRSEAAAEG